MHTEGNDPGRPEGTSPHRPHERDQENPGYETQDVNVGGTVTFLGGLVGFVAVFFVFCFFMGKGINNILLKQDGPVSQWKPNLSQPGKDQSKGLENLKSNGDIEQAQMAQVTKAFPTPTLETDDGNQDMADLHAREDLLLNYTSSAPDGSVRIPITQAMAMVVKQGLPKPAGAQAAKKPMAGEESYDVHAPLTDGFARTGYELAKIEERKQQNESEGKKE